MTEDERLLSKGNSDLRTNRMKDYLLAKEGHVRKSWVGGGSNCRGDRFMIFFCVKGVTIQQGI